MDSKRDSIKKEQILLNMPFDLYIGFGIRSATAALGQGLIISSYSLLFFQTKLSNILYVKDNK